jgi:hypothetical protein
MALLRSIGGLTSIAAGVTHYWWYEIDGGHDMGVTTAAVNFWDSDVNTEVTATNPGVILIPTANQDAPLTQYRIVINNLGPGIVNYNLNLGYF